MANHLKWYEVLGGLGLAVALIAWKANSDSPDSPAPAAKPAQPVAATAPKHVTIRSGAVICFSREDWESFKSAVVDNHMTQLKLLFDGGRCQQTSAPMVAQYLDPVTGGAALVQTPGGRGAFVFLKDTQ